MTKGYGSPEVTASPLYAMAEDLLDHHEQLTRYDQAKWELVGHPDQAQRREGEMPWLTRQDERGYTRAYTLDVFSGVSTATQSLLVVRKDRWTDPHDPLTWLAVETNLATGRTIEQTVWSARVDAARRMWLEIAPARAANQPVWYEYGQRRQAFRSKPPYDQTRITAQLDEHWHTDAVEFRDGLRGPSVGYEDVEALESMIIAIQQLRQAELERTRAVLLGSRAEYGEALLAA